ncbi:hypothetical protein CR205_14975 [Alteribacter lacisalsi]|uniref:Uncharacterized protein n=1 Tax=Alteribacter lacisalsi TaxID=2045244 RepID=A0A2W0H566_9BACI|nr:hypothetical protein [Alteribacter lacisalsi]PYZ96973.1 hypothetical protein CR205_14975 [Alteribacter lacisalsi]
MKRLFAYITGAAAIMLASACSEDASGSEPDFSGNLLNAYQITGMATVFIEDNVSGTDFDPDILRSRHDEVLDDYELEAYRITFDDETTIIFADTGEEITYDTEEERMYTPYFLSLGQEVSVKVREDFEPVISTHLSSRSPYEWSLIPIYTAETIEVGNVSIDTLISMYSFTDYYDHTPVIQVLSFMDDSLYSEDRQHIHEKFYDYFSQDQHVVYSQVGGEENLMFFDHLFDEFPHYLVLEDEELIYETGDLDDIFRFLDDDLGLEKN